MRKKLFISILLSSTLVTSFSITPAYAKNPWEMQTDKNLFTLINDGFDMVGGNVAIYGVNGPFEIIYLKKGKQLYKCIYERKTSKCYVLVDQNQ